MLARVRPRREIKLSHYRRLRPRALMSKMGVGAFGGWSPSVRNRSRISGISHLRIDEFDGFSECLGEPPASSVEHCADGSGRDAHRICELQVAEISDVAKGDRRTFSWGQSSKRVPDFWAPIRG